jgi:hypothetical protein
MRLRNIGSIAAASRKIFRDTFNRANQTGIGTSSDGSTWNIIRGSFNITSDKADGQTPANYPLASVDMPKEEVTISLSGITQGSTAALWVTDGGNWFGVGIDQESISCNCQTCSTPGNCASTNYQCNVAAYPCQTTNYQCNVAAYPCNGTSFACNAWNSPCNAGNYFCDVVGNRFCRSYTSPCNAMSTPFSPCTRWSRVCNGGYNTGNCNMTNSSFMCTTWNRVCPLPNQAFPCSTWATVCNEASYPCATWSTVCNSASYPCASFNATTFFSCNCQTCFPQYIRFIQSAANTVTTLTSWLVASAIQSIRVIISSVNPAKTSATATIKPYSDTNLSSQIGSDLTYTPTGVAINAKYGIMVKPSSYSQGTTIDEITIETN